MVVQKFELRDFVRVIHGQHRRLEGCITQMKDSAIWIFQPRFSASRVRLVNEFNGNAFTVTFYSSARSIRISDQVA